MFCNQRLPWGQPCLFTFVRNCVLSTRYPGALVEVLRRTLGARKLQGRIRPSQGGQFACSLAAFYAKQKGGSGEEYPTMQSGGAYPGSSPGLVPVSPGGNGISEAWALPANRLARQRHRQMADRCVNRQLRALRHFTQ